MVTLLVNVTNSFEKQEIMPEMLELAKFAKHHISGMISCFSKELMMLNHRVTAP